MDIQIWLGIAFLAAVIMIIIGVNIHGWNDRAGAALVCNVFVIVLGVLIAVIGLLHWLAVDPADNALRQTVSALWVIHGLLGVLIAAIGLLGATIVHTLRNRQ